MDTSPIQNPILLGFLGINRGAEASSNVMLAIVLIIESIKKSLFLAPGRRQNWPNLVKYCVWFSSIVLLFSLLVVLLYCICGLRVSQSVC